MSREHVAESRRARLAEARLYLIVEARVGNRPAAEVVEPALRGGVDLVQLREKDLADAEVVESGRELAGLCERHGALLVVNDRPELALACGADGVHVGQDDAPPAEVRRRVSAELLIGVSTHSPAQVAVAAAGEADYLGVGPVFSTPTKPDAEPVGLDLVRHAAAHAAKPFFAIGGIDAETVEAVAEAGATRVAVVRAIRDADDPRAAAATLRAALDRAGTGRRAAVGTPG